MEQDALLGQIVDKYQILERIGSGGVAHVYKAVHIENQAVYALKVIRRSLLDNDYAVHRFRGEIDILQQLKHPHIVDLFASGKIDNRPYMLIEYLPLGTLRHFLVE